MNNFGFIKTALGIPFLSPGNPLLISETIIDMIEEASKENASIILFPELSLTGYTCQDLFGNSTLINAAEKALIEIKNKTKFLDILIIVGLPVYYKNCLYNCAAIMQSGNIYGIIPKTHIAYYKEFYESRWFKSGIDIKNETIQIDNEDISFGTDLIFSNEYNKMMTIGIEICEDLWVPSPPSEKLALQGATIIANLSASNALIGKIEYRHSLVQMQSSKLICAYLYSNASSAESTTDLVFDGDGIIYENGILQSQSERFLRKNQIIYSDIDLEKIYFERSRNTSYSNSQDNFRTIYFRQQQKKHLVSATYPITPFVPSKKEARMECCNEILNIQASGLAKRLEVTKTKAVIGLSGGLDSTLALLVTIKAMNYIGRDPKTNIIPITMPGFGTTDLTYKAVVELCKQLDLVLEDVSIKGISNTMLDTIEHPNDIHDITYENIQARARTYILMTLANKYKAIVVGTGDLSELALGWSTYNGDHSSMYNVNASVPKTLVKFLIEELAEKEYSEDVQKLLKTIVSFPISPELLPNDGKTVVQETEQIIGPYILHDYFLYLFVRWGFSKEKILFLATKSFEGKYSFDEISSYLEIFFKRFFTSQWKRDCVPAGPKVGTIDLSPRGSWRMSADIDFSLFYK